jgi:hypothetical protein
MTRRSGDFFGALKNWLIPAEENELPAPVTNNDILDELADCFDNSCRTESVGSSLVFNMYYMVIIHPDVYEQRLPSLPVVVKEAVKMFYKKLQDYKKHYEDLAPVSSHWQFRFGPATDFNGAKIELHDKRVIGMLTGLKSRNMDGDRRHTAKVTMKSKATNVFDKMDINLDVLRHIHFAESGNFTVKFNSELSLRNEPLKHTRNYDQGLARIDYFMGDTNKGDVYLMKDTEIVIARREPENLGYSNYLLVDSAFVSNPHARIRLNESTGKFQIASFSMNETRVNETVIAKSDAAMPRWFDLEPKSQVLLNGMVTLDFKQY